MANDYNTRQSVAVLAYNTRKLLLDEIHRRLLIAVYPVVILSIPPLLLI
jgi:hypothetical protein